MNRNNKKLNLVVAANRYSQLSKMVRSKTAKKSLEEHWCELIMSALAFYKADEGSETETDNLGKMAYRVVRLRALESELKGKHNKPLLVELNDSLSDLIDRFYQPPSEQDEEHVYGYFGEEEESEHDEFVRLHGHDDGCNEEEEEQEEAVTTHNWKAEGF